MRVRDPDLVLFQPLALLAGETVSVTTPRDLAVAAKATPGGSRGWFQQQRTGGSWGPCGMTALEVAEGWLGRSVFSSPRPLRKEPPRPGEGGCREAGWRRLRSELAETPGSVSHRLCAPSILGAPVTACGRSNPSVHPSMDRYTKWVEKMGKENRAQSQ